MKVYIVEKNESIGDLRYSRTKIEVRHTKGEVSGKIEIIYRYRDS